MAGVLVGLIGDPVAHSISPLFQQAAFDALGIDARYERWLTAPRDLLDRVALLRMPTYLGANVTGPHKERVRSLVDVVDLIGERAGAVNTVYKRDGRLLGSNTDVAGFRRALRETAGCDAAGKRAIVLGAGGAARAVVLALEQEGAGSVAVANRNPERAERLVRELRSDSAPNLIAMPWSDATGGAVLSDADLLIHCTTVGMAGSPDAADSPVCAAALHGKLLVCDIVANPLLTPLLREAEQAGAGRLGGLPMLVYQGAASFELWTGSPAPVQVMLAAAYAAMADASAH